MELVKDIYFNTDKLIENTKVKVSYTGKFYQGNNEKVYIHYGYGKNWNNINEIEMQKTDLGYQTELQLTGDDTVNFCFKNQNNEWDNNFGENYIFNIEKVPNNFGNLVSGIIEDTIIGTPNSIDAIINNNPTNIINTIASINNEISDTTDIIETATTVSAENQIKINNIEEQVNQTTAIALAPKGFNLWTKKIKTTVCKFFAYVPKLISGNYKRKVSEENNK